MRVCVYVCGEKQDIAHEPLINIFYAVVGPGAQETTTESLQDCVDNHSLDDGNSMLSSTASDSLPPVASASSSKGGESTTEYDDSDDSFRDRRRGEWPDPIVSCCC